MKVLVVEDETIVRECISDVLEMLGHDVQRADSGEAALEGYQASAPFDVVLLDLTLPGLSGEQVLERMLALEPGQRVVVTSGYASEQLPPALQAALQNDRRRFLAKPFDLDELLALFDALLVG